MMQNALGHFVPAHLVKTEFKLEDQLARDLVARSEKSCTWSFTLQVCVFKYLHVLPALLGEKYEVNLGGTRGAFYSS